MANRSFDLDQQFQRGVRGTTSRRKGTKADKYNAGTVLWVLLIQCNVTQD